MCNTRAALRRSHANCVCVCRSREYAVGLQALWRLVACVSVLGLCAAGLAGPLGQEPVWALLSYWAALGAAAYFGLAVVAMVPVVACLAGFATGPVLHYTFCVALFLQGVASPLYWSELHTDDVVHALLHAGVLLLLLVELVTTTVKPNLWGMLATGGVLVAYTLTHGAQTWASGAEVYDVIKMWASPREAWSNVSSTLTLLLSSYVVSTALVHIRDSVAHPDEVACCAPRPQSRSRSRSRPMSGAHGRVDDNRRLLNLGQPHSA
jgi:hypothetical protein